MIFNKIFGKNVTYYGKWLKNSFTLSSESIFFEIYSLGWGVDVIFNETSILVFAELAIFHSI